MSSPSPVKKILSYLASLHFAELRPKLKEYNIWADKVKEANYIKSLPQKLQLIFLKLSNQTKRDYYSNKDVPDNF